MAKNHPDIPDVAERDQELFDLLAEVESAGAIGRERYRPGDLGERLGIEDVAAARLHGQLHAPPPPDGGARPARGVGYQRRGGGAPGRRPTPAPPPPRGPSPPA